MSEITYEPLTQTYFKQVIELANRVHGDGYLSEGSLTDWVDRSITNSINCSFVALKGDKLIGFRSTFSANQWHIDQWCTPELWKIPTEKCCYFKCNTVDENYRGMGVGKHLLQLSINAATKQGALAGVSHLWRQSPNNSAVAYFTHCGGELVKNHPDKWNEESKQGYNCILCGHDCHCEAAEMIIHFD
jgi:GNAT superfamily N-acetyltransferase